MSDPFHTPRLVCDLLAGFQRPWFIAGGWAIDLFLGAVTRPHDDIDIAMLRVDQRSLRAYLSGWQWTKVLPAPTGGLRRPWSGDEWLDPPLHELHASQKGRELEFLLNESDGQNWLFRRNPRVTLPLSRLGLSPGSGHPPILAPEVVLLYKAKDPQQRDEHDFRAALPALDPQRRAWLHDAIQTCHPGHHWLRQLR